MIGKATQAATILDWFDNDAITAAEGLEILRVLRRGTKDGTREQRAVDRVALVIQAEATEVKA